MAAASIKTIVTGVDLQAAEFFMKTSAILILGMLLAGGVTLTAAAEPTQQKLLDCRFRESMSVSFGYSSVYTFMGSITDVGERGTHFYELKGPIDAVIEHTASTNFRGKKIA